MGGRGRTVRGGTDRYVASGTADARSRMVSAVVAAAARRGLAADRVSAASLAVHECLVNAREHGHLGDPDLRIVVEVAGPVNGVVTATVTDTAAGGPWVPDTGPPHGRWPPEDTAGVGDAGDPSGERGRGLLLAAAGVDELSLRSDPGATAVTLTWNVDDRTSPSGPGPTDERR